MKVFLAILVLIFGLQSLSKAEDMIDFQIEGISVNESLLKYMSKKKILDDLEYIYPNDGFWAVTFKPNYSLEQYDNVQIHGKKNDPNFNIYSITADLFFSDIDECLKKKKDITTYIKKNFSYIYTEDITKKHAGDKKTTTHSTWIDFQNGSILVACYDWSKQSGFPKTTKVTIDTKEFLDWLNNEAYEE